MVARDHQTHSPSGDHEHLCHVSCESMELMIRYFTQVNFDHLISATNFLVIRAIVGEIL